MMVLADLSGLHRALMQWACLADTTRVNQRFAALDMRQLRGERISERQFEAGETIQKPAAAREASRYFLRVIAYFARGVSEQRA
jgi:hypothetical protein